MYESVIAWIQFNPNDRRVHLPELMENVRLPLIGQEYLVSRVENEPLLKEDLHCKDYIIEALKYHLLKGDAKTNFKTSRTIPRQPVGLPVNTYYVLEYITNFSFQRDITALFFKFLENITRCRWSGPKSNSFC